MRTKIQESILEIDALIRAGKGAEAQAQLKPVVARQIPLDFATPLARLARRVGHPDIGLRLLNGIVRPGSRKKKEATDEEKIEYAACLINVGATEEALIILDELTERQSVEAKLIGAFALFSQWNYGQAISLLEEYLTFPNLPIYQRLVGQVNLAAAFIFERAHDQASSLLLSLNANPALTEYHLLRGNVHELLAQNAIFAEHWSEASDYLNTARSALLQMNSIEAFFVRKWEVLLKLLKTGDLAARKELEVIRKEALKWKHWETIRACDRYEGIKLRSHPLFERVYFGTPYTCLRSRLIKDMGTIAIPPSYLWEPAGVSKPRNQIDLDAEQIGKKNRMQKGSLLWRLLNVLASDFYRPLPTATVHFRLYAGEFYNPVSSPNRVHQSVNRLRAWMKEQGWPISIEQIEGAYRLKVTGPVGLRKTCSPSFATVVDSRLDKLKQGASSESFTAKDAANILGASTSTSTRVLEQAIRSGEVQKIGVGRSTRYSFIKKAG